MAREGMYGRYGPGRGDTPSGDGRDPGGFSRVRDSPVPPRLRGKGMQVTGTGPKPAGKPVAPFDRGRGLPGVGALFCHPLQAATGGQGVSTPHGDRDPIRERNVPWPALPHARSCR